ncbi:MAG: DNA-3-methyladenine glycosylase 2 family protein [Sphingobacteriales bacterium]|nr:DNA-3-methyladenine glycosylase 2 family protein [Sphingobacteriales bacterium]
MEHIQHLSRDEKLRPVIERIGIVKVHKRKNICLHLCSSIMSQQLSTKVVQVFHRRFLELYDKKEPSPQQVIDTPFEKLRAIGLSNAKATYIQNVCRYFIEQKITDAQLYKLTNEEVIDLLTQIKGVGKWTVEMILMFTLGREDVFAIDDLGLQQAVIGLYGLKHRKKKIMRDKILKISEQWAPYRTYASMYLWRWKDNEPVA